MVVAFTVVRVEMHPLEVEEVLQPREIVVVEILEIVVVAVEERVVVEVVVVGLMVMLLALEVVEVLLQVGMAEVEEASV